MAGATRATVLTHGYCFDGLVSAALATHLVRARHGELDFSYRSCGYGPKLKRIPESWLSGDVNALLDFRYVESARLTYYFDHHATAFASADERAQALDRVERSGGARQLFHDSDYGSCAKLLDDVARLAFGVDMTPFEELVRWADTVDAARFDSPEEAFFAKAPALVLADIAERHADGAFVASLVPELLTRSIEDVAASPRSRELFAPIAAGKEAFLRHVSESGIVRGGVAVVDLAQAAPMRPVGKFATYVAFPGCTYSVALLRTEGQLKVGVGYNPWSGRPRRHDIASLCKREGGGGHAVVGAITFAAEDVDRARAVAERLAEELSEEPDPPDPSAPTGEPRRGAD